MTSIIILISQVIEIFIWFLIAQAILSWLVAFNIVNTTNNLVNLIGNFLYKVTEPLLKPIRSILPDFGGIDVSPIILIILLIFFRNILFEYSGALNFN